MKFKIFAVSKETGEDIELVIEADSQEEAEKKAYAMNLVLDSSKTELVQEVNPLPVRAAASVVEHQGHAPQAPVQQTAFNPTVNVNVKSNSNSLGIASVILGILSLFICWIPFINVFGILLGCLGFVLALVGLIIAITRSGYGIGFPIAGLALNVLPVLIAFIITGGIVSAADAVRQSATASNTPPAVAPTGNGGSTQTLASNEIIFVALSNKRIAEQNYQEHIWFDVTFDPANIKKSTRAVKGTFVFADLFNDVQYRVRYTLDDSLQPYVPLTIKGIGVDFNMFKDSHTWLRSTDLNDMNIWFDVDTILYQDGDKEEF